MTLDCSKPKHIKLNMVDYVAKILEEMPKEMDGTATSPAAAYLFKIVVGAKLLDDTNSEFFHATVSKLVLFLCKQG
jgi:hypothetical protein